MLHLISWAVAGTLQTKIMFYRKYNIDDETISNLGLEPTDAPINASIAPHARVFRYPQLVDVFIMESDLYGNTMPENSCFLAFYGNHGLIGKHLKMETLKNSSIHEIRELIATHNSG